MFQKENFTTDFPGLFYGIQTPQKYKKFRFRYIAHHFYKKNDAIGFLPTKPMPLFCLQKNGPKGEQITYFNFNINIM